MSPPEEGETEWGKEIKAICQRLNASKASIAFDQFNATPGSRGAALCVGNDLWRLRGCFWVIKRCEDSTPPEPGPSLKKLLVLSTGSVIPLRGLKINFKGSTHLARPPKCSSKDRLLLLLWPSVAMQGAHARSSACVQRFHERPICPS